MRLFRVAPAIADNDDEPANDHRFRAYSERIADLIVSHVAADPALFAMRHIDEGTEAHVQPDTRYGDTEAVRISVQIRCEAYWRSVETRIAASGCSFGRS